MDANTVFPSRHLSATDVGDRRVTVTIENIEIETLGQGEDQEKKPVIYFEGKEKGLVCNKTNWKTLISLFGPETNNWNGMSFTLCTAPVDFRGKTTMALRILPAPAKAAPAAAKAAPVSKDMADDDISF